jgi:hypothetical protein
MGSVSSPTISTVLLKLAIDFYENREYDPPVTYTGKGTVLTQLAHTVNNTHFTLTYRCQKCTTWDQGGQKGNQSMKGESYLFGWAQAKKPPSQPKSSTSYLEFHDLGFGIFPIEPKVVANANYDTMAAMAPKGGPSGGGIAPVPASTPAKAATSANSPSASASAKGTTPAKSPSAPSPAKGTTSAKGSTSAKGTGPGKSTGKSPKSPQRGGPERRLR